MQFLAAALVCLLCCAGVPAASAAAAAGAARPPNFVLILMDDMDTMMNSSDRAYMPRTWRDIVDQGTWFRNMAVSMAWCCPSRVSLFTGKLVHNSNITSSSKPMGGAWKFMTQGMDSDYLPVWLQRLGYSTYFSGKFLNQYSAGLGCPRGWSTFEGMIDEGNFDEWYYKPLFSANCSGTWRPNGTYHQTDIIRDKGLGYIDNAVAQGKPFFIELAPTGPHDQGLGKVAVPCLRHQNLYTGMSMPRFPNWGLPLPAVMGISTAVSMEYSTSKYVPRLRTVAGIDELVESVMERLKFHGIADNTYVIVTSDNGFHLGGHGMPYEKFTMYEEDVRVPFFMRGPGVPRGVMTDYQMTMVDVTATVLSLAGGAITEALDGVPLPLAALGSSISVTALPKIQPAQPQTQSPKRSSPTRTPPSPPIAKATLKTKSPKASPSQIWSPGMPVPFPPSPAPPSHLSPSPSPLQTLPPPPPPPPPPPYPQVGDLLASAPEASWSVRHSMRSVLETLEARELERRLQGEYSLGVVPDSLPLSSVPDSSSSTADDSARRQLLDNYTNAASLAIVRDTILIEGWLDIGWSLFHRKNFRSVRVCSPVYVFGFSSTYLFSTCYKYTVWCIPANSVNRRDGLNLHELYDLGLDPYEVLNRYANPTALAQRLINRLDAVLSSMAYCKGSGCRNPWRLLHPDGSANSLLEAMSPVFDAYYSQMQKFAFRSCNLFYDPANEIADRSLRGLFSG